MHFGNIYKIKKHFPLMKYNIVLYELVAVYYEDTTYKYIFRTHICNMIVTFQCSFYSQMFLYLIN